MTLGVENLHRWGRKNDFWGRRNDHGGRKNNVEGSKIFIDGVINHSRFFNGKITLTVLLSSGCPEGAEPPLLLNGSHPHNLHHHAKSKSQTVTEWQKKQIIRKNPYHLFLDFCWLRA
eukprot:12206897-Karenia_brevis.AAC.1